MEMDEVSQRITEAYDLKMLIKMLYSFKKNSTINSEKTKSFVIWFVCLVCCVVLSPWYPDAEWFQCPLSRQQCLAVHGCVASDCVRAFHYIPPSATLSNWVADCPWSASPECRVVDVRISLEWEWGWRRGAGRERSNSLTGYVGREE